MYEAVKATGRCHNLKCIGSAIAFIILSLLTGCSSEKPVIAKDGNIISYIHININGAANASRPDMIDTCKGFLLSKSQITSFFVYSYPVKDSSTAKKSSILPCYVSGTAIINDLPYTWKIRAGGIGEFINKSRKLTKVCGQQCCEKIPGVC